MGRKGGRVLGPCNAGLKGGLLIGPCDEGGKGGRVIGPCDEGGKGGRVIGPCDEGGNGGRVGLISAVPRSGDCILGPKGGTGAPGVLVFAKFRQPDTGIFVSTQYILVSSPDPILSRGGARGVGTRLSIFGNFS